MKIKQRLIYSLIIFLFLGIIISLLLTLFADFQKTRDTLFSFKYRYAIIILLLSFISFFIRFFRWHYFLTVMKISSYLSFKESMLIFFSGMTMVVTPGRSGEVMKAYFLKKKTGFSLSGLLPIVMIERFTDGIAALLLMTGGLILYQYGIPFIILIILLSFLFLLLLQHKSFMLFLFEKAGQIRAFRPFLESFKRFYSASHTLTRVRPLLIGIIIGFLAWGLQASGLYFVLKGLGIEGNFFFLLLTAFFIFSFVGIIGFATLLPGGIGVAEGTTTGLLLLFLHLDKNVAVAATLLFRLFTLWIGIFFGLVMLSILLRHSAKNYDRN